MIYTYTLYEILLFSSLLLFTSILMSKPSTNYGIPSLLVFLGVGMLFGNGGKYDFYFDAPYFAEAVGGISLAFILFSGGTNTKWIYIKGILPEGLTLATLGVLLSVIAMALCVHWITEFDLLTSFLIGSIVSSTDAAAVFSIMKTKQLTLKEGITRTLELESGANDPMAYFLTISITKLIVDKETTYFELLPDFFLQMAVGAIIGFMMGKLLVWLLNIIHFDIKGLHPVFIISIVLITYSLTNLLSGSSFLAVYISGIIVGNGDFEEKTENINFFEGLSWLMQVTMFLILGLQVFPDKMFNLIGLGLLCSFILIFIARPLSVWICLSFFKATWRKKVFVSWVGLKGATPIIFALYPGILHIKHSDEIFNVVFFIVITSVLLQGSSLGYVAKKLNLIKHEIKQ